MCGRYTLTASSDALVAAFELESAPEMAPRFNIAPTQEVAAVRLTREGKRRADLLRWGLIPSWAKDRAIGNRMINARSETAAEKPSFRAAFKRRRCLVLADGYYEWVKLEDGSKQPYFIRFKGFPPFAMAGLWERWKDGEETVDSCTILTTGPNELMKPIHHRMPVILPKERIDTWLDREVEDRETLEPFFEPHDSGEMEAYPVTRFVNSPRNDSPACLEAAD